MGGPADGMSPKYTVTVRDQEFRLSKRQIEFDSPNFFTACFLGSFQESSSKSVALDRNPQLFAIIVEYLSGYEILPLPAAFLSERMDAGYVTRNLFVDADFYGLMGLKRLLTTPKLPPSLGLEWAGLARKIVTLSEVVSENLPPGVEYVDGGLYSEEEGNQLPVLVYARDVPVRLSASREMSSPGGMMAKTNSDRIMFKIDYAEFRGGAMATAIKHPPTIVAESVFSGGKMRINDLVMSLTYFSSWWQSNTRASIYDREGEGSAFLDFQPSTLEPAEAPYCRYEGVLWADEALFTVVGRSSDAGDPVLHIKLADLKARSRGAVLSDLSPPGSRWARV
ncbi:hypothetical protein NEOLEDRAFT_1148028 [Neolentinus lepideus HHB14362 ss-1]|uniref:BTB domain-containing protein n=1 Tax=Neolentinus lepideus HHB14362 ss-1 TaxID=1314782 RepID=A0A165SML8_9AGAM|nr:hypothetical protein NEOLEDRAFT_1148028 [Neolentinus lepideus HHB14362 ss-1]